MSCTGEVWDVIILWLSFQNTQMQPLLFKILYPRFLDDFQYITTKVITSFRQVTLYQSLLFDLKYLSLIPHLDEHSLKRKCYNLSYHFEYYTKESSNQLSWNTF